MKAYLLKIRGGVEVDSKGNKAGKGPLIAEEVSATLGVSQDQTLFQPIGVDFYNQTLTGDKAMAIRAKGDTEHLSAVVYGISGYESNAMKSSNPHSGIYEAKTSRTLDLNGGNPACNQGGIAIVEAVGVDAKNTCLTGDVTKTMTAGRNDKHNIPCVIAQPMFWDGGQVASGAQRMPDKDNFNCILEPIAIDRAAFNQGKNAQFGFSVDSGGVAQTVIAKGPGAVCYKKPSEACVQETSRESETNM